MDRQIKAGRQGGGRLGTQGEGERRGGEEERERGGAERRQLGRGGGEEEKERKRREEEERRQLGVGRGKGSVRAGRPAPPAAGRASRVAESRRGGRR
jgi:hypothetical protein